MEKSENGLSNLLANRMPNLNNLSTNLQLRSDLANNNDINSLNQAALMNAFSLASGLPLPLNLWENNPLISAMSQYMEANNPLLNLKQESSDHQKQSLKRTDENNLENKCNKEMNDLKMNKRFKTSSDSFLQNNTQLDHHLNSNNNKTSKDLSYLDNGKSFPCPECHKTFATEVDLKMHLLRHVMQHPFSCSTCGKGFKYEHTLQFHEKQHGVDANNKLNLKNSNKKLSINQQQDDKNLLNLNRKTKYPSTSSSKQQLINNHLNDDEDDMATANLLIQNTKLNHNLNNLNNKQNSSSLFSSNNSSTFEFGFPNSNLGLQMKSEKVLIVMVESVNPVNDQTYTLYKCNICYSAFANLAHVTEHIQTTHSNNQKFNCDKCGANFKWKQELIMHDELHKCIEQQATNKLMLPLIQNNQLMLVNQYLNNNQTKLDNNNNDNLILNSNHLNGKQNLQDNLIGLNLTKQQQQRSNSESSQESLNLTASSISSNSKTNKNNNGRGSKELRNDELDELSKNIAVVKENITNELGEIEETAPGQFKCRYCDKTFDRIFSVHRHERVHTGFKPCICKVCGKGFSEKRNLRHHIIRFHSDGSGRELLRRVRKDKSMNNEENIEAKKQLKQMEMNILSINSNSFQSNNGSDEDLPSNLSILTNNGNNNNNNLKDKQGDNEDNSSNHSGENLINNSSNNSSNISNSSNKPATRNRRKSVPYKVPSKINSPNDQLDTEEDDNSLKSDQTSIKEDDETCSNNDLNE